MYLRNILLRRWGCHDEVQIGPVPGLNIVVGANGVGKSTLFAAIRIALTFKHNSSDEEVRVHQPWGLDDAGPSATLEVVRRDGTWRVQKTYLVEPMCLLERSEGDLWAKHSKSKTAESLMDEWLNGDGASGRLSVRLWSPQDQSTQVIEASANARSAAPASILDRVFSVVAADGHSGPFASIKKSVAERYEKTFSKVDRVVRKNSELDLAFREFQRAESALIDLKRRRDDLSAKVAAYLGRLAAHGADCADRDSLAAEKSRRGEAAEAYRLLRLEADAAEDAASKAAEAYSRELKDFKRLADAEAAVTTASKSLEAIVPRLAEASEAMQAAEADARITEGRRRGAIPRLDRLAGLYDRKAKLAQLAEAVEIRRDRERKCLVIRDRAEDGVQAADGSLSEARLRSDQAASGLEFARKAAANGDLIAAEDAFHQASASVRDAESARLLADRGRLAPIVDRLREIESELAPLDPDGPVPEADELDSLRTEARRLEAELATLDADALTLRFEPVQGVVAAIEADGVACIPENVGPGAVLEARGVAKLVLNLEGIGRVEIGRTSADAETRRQRLEARRVELARKLESWRAGSIEELERRRKRADRRAALTRESASISAGEPLEKRAGRLKEVDAELRVRGLEPNSPLGDPIDEISWRRLLDRRQAAAERVASARVKVEALGAIEATVEIPSIDVPTAELAWKSAIAARNDAEIRAREAANTLIEANANLASATRERKEAESELATLSHGDDDRIGLDIDSIFGELNLYEVRPVGEETRGAIEVIKARIVRDADAARKELADASKAFGDLDALRIAMQARLDQAGETLRSLRDEVGVVETREVREARLQKLLEEEQRTRILADHHRRKLPVDPAANEPDFLASCQRAEKRCHEGEIELNGLLTELEILGRDGIDSEFGRAEERLADRRRKYEAKREEAASWALLHHLLAEVEADQARSTAARIEELAARAVPRLTGGRWTGVSLDPRTLAPTGAVDEGGMARKIERLSRGNREQVALACRLEIGRLLGREFRQMVLLDDPLAHTDAYRLGEAMDVLVEAAEDLQVLIFTCHPERYEPLRRRGAGWFEIAGSPGAGLAVGPISPLQ